MITLAATDSIQASAATNTAITSTVSGDEINLTTGSDWFKTLDQRVLTTSVVSLYSPGTNKAALVKEWVLTNTTASPVLVSLFRNGAVAANQTAQLNIPANGQAIRGDSGWTVYGADGIALTTVGGAAGGDLSGAYPNPTVKGINGTTLSGLGTGLLKNTTGTGVPSIAAAGTDYLVPAAIGVTIQAFDAELQVIAGLASTTNNVIQAVGGAWASRTPTQLTATLDAASSTAAGTMSALDKKIVDNLHYDFVADFGGVGNDSTNNDTQFATAISSMPVGATLFFPSGTYRISAAIDINVDRRYTFRGVNRYTSIIKTTSAAQHTFTKSVAGWFDMWTDLGFQTSVTKTAGAAINIPIGNNVGMNVYRCAFTGMFNAINATGAQSANLSVWSDLDINGIPNGGRGIVINGSTINVMIHNATINAGAATTSACVEINQSGAVQVTACDWIQGTNTMLINATAGAGPQACYFTNCFFDQPQGSVIKITGTQTANRIKFTQCGIAPTGNNYGVEFASTGSGAVGTSTALSGGISIVDCDIYSSNGTNTGAGVFLNGVQDVNIQSSRITGFNGAGGAGILVTPSASNLTKVRINGCIIGPNSNLTITNETGIKLNAGASGLAALSITDNTISGNGTAITDNSTMMAGVSKNINNNTGAAAGLQSSFAGAQALSATEFAVLQIPLPANSVKVGTVFRFQVTGTSIVTVTTTARLHIGPLGTVADPQVVTTAVSAAGVVGGLVVSGAVAITVVGATAGGNGAIQITTGTATSAPAITATGTFNSAVANIVTVGLLTSAAGHTVRAGTLDIVSPA